MKELKATVQTICRKFSNDRSRLMDIALATRAELGSISQEAIGFIAASCGMQRVEVDSLLTFYSFLAHDPGAVTVIRLCNDLPDRFENVDAVAKAIEDEAGIKFGQISPDGKLALQWTPCIGMSDQAPAALANDVVVTSLTPASARSMVKALKAGKTPQSLVTHPGDGNNAHRLVKSMVKNNLRLKGAVIFADYIPGSGLAKAIAMSPAEVIRDIKTSRLRGRGGAGFPTGMKWDFARQAEGKVKYVICNADEGEPGTFKDRVILTECPELLLEGMTIAGYATGAATGILYLRAEYAYLRAFLEDILEHRRKKGLLGKSVCGKGDFSFDIRIQMGAGAYVCGEETALISSCEGFRGDPKTRPPFPAQKGYMAGPTTVNNVETFCCAARILQEGPGWFAQMGSKGSPGTKLISISGDCKKPGVYEIPFGMKLADLLKLAGAESPAAVQVGGPSGQMIGPKLFDRTICYDDLATGGSVIVLGKGRDILEAAALFMDFFADESCGYCTPCRAGNVLIRERLEKIRNGAGETSDLAYLEKLGKEVKFLSRCGLGQTSPNPVLTTMKNFPEEYARKIRDRKDGMQPEFDIKAALKDAESLAGRTSVHV